jgi:hypothetical protein
MAFMAANKVIIQYKLTHVTGSISLNEKNIRNTVNNEYSKIL